MKLSEHFTLEELTYSSTADSFNSHVTSPTEMINNTPSRAEIEWLKYLCIYVLEPLRKKLGRPVYINSGYRCPKLNALVGGAFNSQHICGQAADLRVLSKTEASVFFFILQGNKFVDQALYERKANGSQWIHVSVAPMPRQLFNFNYSPS